MRTFVQAVSAVLIGIGVTLFLIRIDVWVRPVQQETASQFELLRVDHVTADIRVSYLFHDPSGWCFLLFDQRGTITLDQVYTSLCYAAMTPERKTQQDEKDRREHEANEKFWRELEQRKADETRKQRSEGD